MNSKLVVQFDSDSATQSNQEDTPIQSDNKSFSHIKSINLKPTTTLRQKNFFKQTSQTARKEEGKSDRFNANKIQKNLLYSEDEDFQSKFSSVQQKKQRVNPECWTMDKKSCKVDRKVHSSIKLKPLKSLQFQSKNQTAFTVSKKLKDLSKGVEQQLEPNIVQPGLRKIQSNYTSSLSKMYLNFEESSSSDDEELQISPSFKMQHLGQSGQGKSQLCPEDQKIEKLSQRDKIEQNNDKANHIQILPLTQNVSQQKNNQKDSSNDSCSNKAQFSLSLQDKLRSYLCAALDQKTAMSFRLKRSKNFFNYFSPEFHLELARDHYFLMAAKKTSSKPSSTFVFSLTKGEFDENCKFFMGKMKSNLTGTILNIFGKGPSPQIAEQMRLKPRQLLATVVYHNQFLGQQKPRDCTVYLKNSNFDYYHDFEETTLYGEEISLNQIYSQSPKRNKEKITLLRTKNPKWNEKLQCYTLDFKGKVKISSSKNFILEGVNGEEYSLLFGKVEEDVYHLQIKKPFSPIVGLAVALTTFDTRIGSI